MEPLVDAVVVSSQNSGRDCLQVYDGANGSLLKSYRGNPVAPASLCPLGRAGYLMAGQRDGPFLQAWAINRHDPVQVRLVVPGRVSAMAVTAAGPKYCAAGVGEKVYVYQMLSGRLVGVLSRHYQTVSCLLFTPCGNYLVSGGDDGFVYLWSLASLVEALHKDHPPPIQPHTVLGQHSDKVTDLAVTGAGVHGGFLVSSSLDHTARVHDLATGRALYTLVTAGEITCVASNTLGSQLVLGHREGTVQLVSLLPPPPPGDVQVTSKGVECHKGRVRCLGVSASGNVVVSGGEDGEVKLWSVSAPHDSTTTAPCLALQRLLHTGRGAITNLLILRTDRQTLTDTDLEVDEVITPFSQDQSSPLTAPVTVKIRGRGGQRLDHLDLFNYSPDHSTGQALQQEEGDEQTSITQVKLLNSQLYKFALRSIVDENEN